MLDGRSRRQYLAIVLALILWGCAGKASAQTSAFTYQGRLIDGGTPANGNYDLQFTLWDAANGGSQIGSLQNLPAVQVSAGVFTVTLDFGANAFPGANRFLEISARLSGASSYTPLSPRQPITSTPYAVRSGNATIADNALQLGGVTSSQYVQTNDARLTDSRSPTAGSANYIQNTTNQQASSNFNISGNGTVGGALSATSVNANGPYKVGGSRILSTANANDLFVGFQAGQANTTGTGDSFFGYSAGELNTTGTQNSFFGYQAGQNNTTGGSNSFFGLDAGSSNTTADRNSFFGAFAGLANTTGDRNSFFGQAAGFLNTTGTNNAFFGDNAGYSNTLGASNSFFGTSAGQSNTTASGNAFFGTTSGQANTTGYANSFFGFGTGSVNTTGYNNSFFGFDAGVANSTGLYNSFFGFFAGHDNTTGATNSFFGSDAGNANTSGFNNSFVGLNSGQTNTTGTNNTIVGVNADVGSNNLDHATAIGADAVVAISNSIALGRGDGLDTVRVPGKLSLLTLGAAGSTQLCRNGFLFNEIATCSSSLRYKKDIASFTGGLNLLARLRPITFTWKDRPERDLGLAAEDVAKVEPLLITYNAKGEIEGVKYDRLNVVLINSIKQQQSQIEQLTARLQVLEKQLRNRNRRGRH